MSLSLLFHRIAFPAWHQTEPRRRRTTNVRKRAPISRKPSALDSRLPRKLLETCFDKNCLTIPKKRFDTCLHNLSFFTQTCDSCLICLCVMLASLRKGSPFIGTRSDLRKNAQQLNIFCHKRPCSPGEFVFPSLLLFHSLCFGKSFP